MIHVSVTGEQDTPPWPRSVCRRAGPSAASSSTRRRCWPSPARRWTPATRLRSCARWRAAADEQWCLGRSSWW